MLILGIDPGIRGAIASLDHNDAPSVRDMPVRQKQGNGKAHNEVDPVALQKLLRELVPADETGIVVMESMHAFMGGGEERKGSMASQASLAATKAVICAICEINGLDVSFITPQTWQRFYGIKNRKDDTTKAQSLRIARQLYGMSHCPLQKHDGRADAILIARYGRRHFV
jgi:hypothetical protein